MKTRLAAALFLCLVAAPLRAAEIMDDGQRVCRHNLGDLAQAVKSYNAAHDGKLPPKLSDLYYESYADDVTTYRCPAAPGERLKRTEIDDKSDYTLDPLPDQKGIVVRERAPHHGDKKSVLAIFEDGSIKEVPLSEGAVTGGKPAEAGAGKAAETGGANTGRGEASRGGVERGGGEGGGDQPQIFRPTGPDAGGIQVMPGGPALPGDDELPPEMPKGATISRGASRPGSIDEGTREDTDRERRAANAIRGSMPPEVAMNIADTIYKEGGYDAALDFYEKVLADQPKNEHALLGHARSSLRTGALKVARENAQKLLDITPDHAEAKRIAATVDLIHGETKRAADAAEALYKDHAEDSEVALLRAQATLYSGNQADAKKQFEALAKSNPRLAAEQSKLAGGYMDEHLLKLALLHYLTANALDPTDDETLLNLGLAAPKVGDRDRAIAAFTEFLRRHPNDDESILAKSQLKKLQQK